MRISGNDNALVVLSVFVPCLDLPHQEEDIRITFYHRDQGKKGRFHCQWLVLVCIVYLIIYLTEFAKLKHAI